MPLGAFSGTGGKKSACGSVFGLCDTWTGRKPEPLAQTARCVRGGQKTRMVSWEMTEGPPLREQRWIHRHRPRNPKSAAG